MTDLQSELDANKEECVAHQKVIYDLKLSLESVSHPFQPYYIKMVFYNPFDFILGHFLPLRRCDVLL